MSENDDAGTPEFERLRRTVARLGLADAYMGRRYARLVAARAAGDPDAPSEPAYPRVGELFADLAALLGDRIADAKAAADRRAAVEAETLRRLDDEIVAGDGPPEPETEGAYAHEAGDVVDLTRWKPDYP